VPGNRSDEPRDDAPPVVTGLHHVGHVTASAEGAAATYTRLGFVVPPFEFPAVPSGAHGQLRSFGVGNTHVAFADNFIELVALADSSPPRSPAEGPADGPGGSAVTLVPLEVPPEAVERVAASIENIAARLAAGLERGQPLQILVLETRDADRAVVQLASTGVAHDEVQRVSRKVNGGGRDQAEHHNEGGSDSELDTDVDAGSGGDDDDGQGDSAVTLGYVEIDSAPGLTPEGRLALAEPTPPGTYRLPRGGDHPNGAYTLSGVVLCVAEEALEAVVRRYASYVGGPPQTEAGCHVFHLGKHRIIIATQAALAQLWPGHRMSGTAAFVGYLVKVRDLSATGAFLGNQGIPVQVTAGGSLLVPASAAQGVTVVFE
jgi:glyoxalase-like protein